MKKISVIIPCYNEEKTIEKVIKSIPKEVFEIIVVDNNSTDKTAEIAKKLGARVLKESRQGYGFALQRGFKKAKGDIIVTLDGDGQYPAEKILELVEYLEKNNLDFVNGSRFPLVNKNSLTLERRVGNCLLNFVASILFLRKFKDTQSGMMVFKKEILRKINLESGDMPISQELKIKSILAGFKFKEVHIPYYQRGGESKLSPLKHGFKNLGEIILLRIKTLNPVFLNMFFLCLILILFFSLAHRNLKMPFINVTSDTNGENGLAAINWLNVGPSKLKFGKYINGHLTKESFNFERIKNDGFYVNHPVFFLLPTFLLYKFFGISEITTRLSPFLMMTFGIVLFYLALRKIFKNYLFPLLISLIFVILPGTIYYGTTNELAVFSLPNALITFSLFVFYYYTKKNLYFWLLIFSVISGGLMGWFYFFMPMSIFIFLLFNQSQGFQKERRKLLIFLLLSCFLAFLMNVSHVIILQGKSGIEALKSAFFSRTQRVPFNPWLQMFYQRGELNFNIFFLWLFVFGIFVFFFKYFNDYPILVLLLLMPLLNVIVFYQWSLHPFGPIFFLPAVATFSGILGIFFYEKFKPWGILFLISIFVFGSYFSIKKLDFFVNKFLILKQEDIRLLNELKNQIANEELCLGQNEMGLYYGGISMWYLRKNILFSPNCLKDQFSQKLKFAIVFNPQMGEFYQKEMKTFVENGFELSHCGALWCVLKKK
jgi:glycosyltransferase involved in cell wall biosynthesis